MKKGRYVAISLSLSLHWHTIAMEPKLKCDCNQMALVSLAHRAHIFQIEFRSQQSALPPDRTSPFHLHTWTAWFFFHILYAIKIQLNRLSINIANGSSEKLMAIFWRCRHSQHTDLGHSKLIKKTMNIFKTFLDGKNSFFFWINHSKQRIEWIGKNWWIGWNFSIN